MRSYIIWIFFILLFISCDEKKSLRFSDYSIQMRVIEKNQLAEENIRKQKYDTALIIIDESLAYQNKIRDNELLSKTYFLSGEANYYLDRYQKAIQDYERSAGFSLQAKINELFAKSVYRMGQSYYYLGNYAISLKWLDSALVFAKSKQLDEITADICQAMGRTYRQLSQYEKAIEMINQAIPIYEKLRNTEGMAKAYDNLGWIYFNTGKNHDALVSYNKSLELRLKINDREGIAINFLNIGNVYVQMGNIQEAIKNQQEALKYFQELKHDRGIANCLNNLGMCFENLIEEDFSSENLVNLNKALDYYRQALKYRLLQKDSSEIANSLLNIGNAEAGIVTESFIEKYGKDWHEVIKTKRNSAEIEKEFSGALSNYKEALLIIEKLNDQQRMAMLLNNIGKIYYESGNILKSENYLKKALEISRSNNLLYQEANILMNLGLLYNFSANYDEALPYFNKSLDITIKNGYKSYTRYNYQYISDAYEKLKQFDKAFYFHKLSVQVKDSILNEEKYKAIAELETIYKMREKEKEIQELNLKDQINQGKIRQAKTTIFFISIGVVIIIFFLFIVYRQYIDKRKANLKLEAQNKLIKRQKQDITDSITYASRIQSALLPTKEEMNRLLKDYFIIYEPKDIVSGDFYWLSECKDKVILVVADCTGHGVPGAFMSMLGNAFLNEIVANSSEIHADIILNQLRDKVIQSLHQSVEVHDHKDGMDAVVVIVDYKNMTLEYSGAFNPLLISRGNEIIELQPDRMPVSIHYFKNKFFSRQTLEIKAGDCIYAFSDGFQDQFGGDSMQKFMLKRMKEMFLGIHTLSMSEQKEVIMQSYKNWRGNNPQIDDVLILGFRIV